TENEAKGKAFRDNFAKEKGVKTSKTGLLYKVEKLSDQEIEQTLQAFETRVKTAAQQKMEKDATENEAKGKAFRDNFAKEKGVKTSKTGLLYKVEK
ncbi:FKBP-type peptidyl-prolyl cis-trans isomerase FkpA, partial [Klebsiella pneumoniae]